MKTIKFDNLQGTESLVLVLGPILLFAIGFLKPVAGIDPRIYQGLIVLGFLGQAYYFLKPFIFRNFFQWNKISFTLKIDAFSYKVRKFSDVHRIALEDDRLELVLKGDRQGVVYDLSEIVPADRMRLVELLERHLSLARA